MIITLFIIISLKTHYHLIKRAGMMRTEANGQPTTNAHYLTYIGYESL